jgi:hypothetical protein
MSVLKRSVSRGQGAMEYLMTYGWAILVVMIVGIAMWRLGVFNMGSSTPTSSGFSTLKPLLATCQIKTQPIVSPGTPINGFACQFVNAAGTNVRLRDLHLTVDGQLCRASLADKSSTYDVSRVDALARNNIVPGTNTYVVYMNAVSSCMCNNMSGTSSCTPNDCGLIPVALEIPPDSQFMVITISDPTDNDPCANIVDGQSYTVDVDLAYDATIGGVVVQKHSIGKIQVKGSGNG